MIVVPSCGVLFSMDIWPGPVAVVNQGGAEPPALPWGDHSLRTGALTEKVKKALGVPLVPLEGPFLWLPLRKEGDANRCQGERCSGGEGTAWTKQRGV